MKKFVAVIFTAVFVFAFFMESSHADSIPFDFYKMFEHNGSVMLVIGAEDGSIEHANQAAADFYGFTIEQLEGMKLNDVTMSSEQSGSFYSGLGNAAQTVIEQKLRNGDVKTVEVFSSPCTQGGKTVQLLIINDITQRLLLEKHNKLLTDMVLLFFAVIALLMAMFTLLLIRNYRRLKAKNQELVNFIELRSTYINADNRLIYLKDDNLKYAFVNKAVEKFYGKSAAEIIGLDDFALTSKEFAAMHRETDLRALEKMSVVVDEIEWDNNIYKTTKFPIKLLNSCYGLGAYVENVTDDYRREENLEVANNALEESKEKLQLILNSAAEGIFGVDVNGNCTFCNVSCWKILGYTSHVDLIGKNMHGMIHYRKKDGNVFPADECRIFRTFTKGENVHEDNEIFWRADGSSFDAEYFSYPEYKDGKIIGAVVTFMDITAKKKTEREILFLSYHDPLTGLYNRRYFNERLAALDKEELLPISVIIGDVNGLKQTNDIFGHFTGDTLIEKAASSIQSSCRNSDVVARWGGDEFVILLPKTNLVEGETIAERIKERFSNERIKAFRGSISLGLASKTKAGEDIYKTIENAEEDMYANKVMDRSRFDISTVDSIINILHTKCPREQEHSEKVSELCLLAGKQMKLPESQLRRLKLAGYYHDIGKVVLDDKALNGARDLTEPEWHEFRLHPIVGYRILNSSNDTMDLAKYALSHHESWDGTGYPKGLSGEEIPIFSRVIAIVESYDAIINPPDYFGKAKSKEDALMEIRRNMGKQFDPVIAEIFIKMMMMQ